MSNGQIIVTGASRGIGEAIAVELNRRGFQVAGLSRSGSCSVGTGIVCDMTDESSIAKAIAKVAANGPIVGLVNNAGAHEGKRSADLSLADFELTMRLNASAVMVACRETYPHLKASGDALIVNVGSFFDKLAVVENLAYCASKAAVGAITRCLAAEWARDGIRVLDVALLLRGGVFAELLVRSKADLLFLLHLHSLRAHVLKHADNLLDRARAVTERVSRGEGQRQQNTMPHLSCKDGL